MARRASFRVGGQEMITDEDLASLSSPLQQPPDPQAVESQVQTDQVVQQDPRKIEAATSWFSAGPQDQQIMEYYKANGYIDQFEDQFARDYSRESPQTLDDYIRLGNQYVQATPTLAPHIKRRMLESMPNNIKKDYEARLGKAQKIRDFNEGLELEQQKMITMANTPVPSALKGTHVYDTAGKLVPIETKQKKDMTDIIDFAKQIGATGVPPERVPQLNIMLNKMIANYEKTYGESLTEAETPPVARPSNFDRLTEWWNSRGSQAEAAPVQLSAENAEAEFQALPSGAIFLDPDGQPRRKP